MLNHYHVYLSFRTYFINHLWSLVSLGIIIIGRDLLLALRTAYYRYRTLPEPVNQFD